MTERLHSHTEQLTPEEARALEQASKEIAGTAIRYVAGPGQTFRVRGEHGGRRRSRQRTREVAEGHVAVEVESRGDTHALYERAEEIENDQNYERGMALLRKHGEEFEARQAAEEAARSAELDESWDRAMALLKKDEEEFKTRQAGGNEH